MLITLILSIAVLLVYNKYLLFCALEHRYSLANLDLKIKNLAAFLQSVR